VGERFGTRALGAVISLSSLSTAVSSYVLSADMASSIYTSHIAGAGTICYGAQCFRATFLILAALNAVAVVLGAWLTCRLRSTLYCGEGGKAVAYTSFVAAVGVPLYIRTLQRAAAPRCCCAFGRSLVIAEDEEEALGLLTASRRAALDSLDDRRPGGMLGEDDAVGASGTVLTGGHHESGARGGAAASGSRAVPVRPLGGVVAGSINHAGPGSANPLSYTELPRIGGSAHSGSSGGGAAPPLSPIAHVGSPPHATAGVASGAASPRHGRSGAAANVTRSTEWDRAPLPGSLHSVGGGGPGGSAAGGEAGDLGDTPVARRL
jgi:hypothetical protein